MSETEKYYPVTYLAKEDLLSCRLKDAERIAELTDAQMEFIAERLGEAIMECYWLSLETVLDLYLGKGEKDE